MSIKNIQSIQLGQVGFPMTMWLIETDDTLAEVTASGYLNGVRQTFQYNFSNKDFATVYTTDYKDMFMQISISADNDVSLINPYEQIGSGVSYTGSLVDGHFAVYNGTTGIIKDLGYLPTDASKTKVIMANASTVVSGNISKFTDTSGTIGDAGFNIKSATTAPFNGGGIGNAFSAPGLTSSSIVTAVIINSTNNVSILKAIPSSNTLTVTFSGDPGPGTSVNWIATSSQIS